MSEDKTDEARPEDRPSHFAEINFTKRQQWGVAAAGLTLLGVIYGITHGNNLDFFEKAVATILVTLVPAVGIFFLSSLQKHLREVRLYLEPDDKNPLFRGIEVFGLFASILIIGAIIVFYFLWRGATAC
jgi:hypothetical protein